MANENRYYLYPFADTGTKTTVPDTSVGGMVGYNIGYGADYELPPGSVGRKTIERPEYNAIMYGITKNLKQNQERNHPTWISDAGSGTPFSYDKGVVVDHSNEFWISLEGSNTEEPSAVSTKWSAYSPSSSQEVNAGDSQLAGGNIWPLSGTAENGDDLTGFTRVNLSIGQCVWFPSSATGVISNLNTTNQTATIGSTDVYLVKSSLTDSVNDPSSWGADDIGGTDSTDIFKRMTESGIPAKRNSGTFLLTASTSPIEVIDGFDMSCATINCTTAEGGDPFNRQTRIFRIEQPLQDVTSDFTLSDFVAGATTVSNPAEYEGFLFFNSNTVQMLRDDGGTLSDVIRREPNMIAKDGKLSYPMYLVFFTTGATVGFKPYQAPAEYKMPNFNVTGTIRTPVETRRNNSKVTLGSISTPSDDNIYCPHEFTECCLSELTELTRPKSGNLSSPRLVAYPALHFKSCALTYDSITASDASGWGGVDGSYCRDILVKDSHVTRVSGHAYCADIKIINSTIYDQAAIHGYGYYQIINCKVSFRGTGFKALVQTRTDYMSSWGGTIYIDNIDWDIIGQLDETRVVQCLPAEHDGRPSGVTDFIAFEPTVIVSDIRYTVRVTTPVSGFYTITGMYLGGSGVDNTYLSLKRLADDKCVFKDIKVNSSVDIAFNPLTNGRNYSSVTNVPALAKHNKFSFECERWEATRHYTPASYNDVSLFGLTTFRFSGTSNLPQFYTVRDCEWVNVNYTTPQNNNVIIDGGDTLGVRAAGFITPPTVSVTSSQVTFKGGVNIVDPDTQVGGGIIQMPISVEGANFQHGSYYNGTFPGSTVTLGGTKFNSQLINMATGSCTVRKSSSANEVTSATMVTDITDGVRNTIYYDA